MRPTNHWRDFITKLVWGGFPQEQVRSDRLSGISSLIYSYSQHEPEILYLLIDLFSTKLYRTQTIFNWSNLHGFSQKYFIFTFAISHVSFNDINVLELL